MDQNSELRQRRKVQEEEKPYIPETFAKKIKQLDVYAKIDDDYTVQTSGGGWVSLISILLMIILLYFEIMDYTTIQRRDKLTVDRLSNDKMTISFNISFYEIQCNQLDLDVMDISGQQQMGVSSRIVKLNLDENQMPFKDDSALFYSNNGQDDLTFNSTCGSCYGAGEDNQCCMTCESVKIAYLKRGWDTTFVINNAVQCKSDSKNKKNSNEKTENTKENQHDTLNHNTNQEVIQRVHGCMAWGQLSVSKVAGNFHIAVGHAENQNTRHVHSFGPSDIHKYNVSHHIENLSFGQYMPEIINPLNGKTFIADKLYSQSYYIHIVPTLYRGQKESFVTNQFSANDVPKPVTINPFGQITALPGIFFMYDISPFLHVVTVRSMNFSHFMVRICAVIGGLVAISELVDSILYYTKKG